MIRYIDDENLEKDYFTTCKLDNVYGTINASLFRLYSKNNLGFFWNVYDDSNNICGNLSFVNDTFTICLNDNSCTEEIAKFIDFWENYKYIKYNFCNVKNLDKFIEKAHKLSIGDILTSKTNSSITLNNEYFCKDIDLYSAFAILKESFPEKMKFLDFSSFNYEMNYRIRNDESFVYGIKNDGVVVSIAEVLCCSDTDVILGCLATKHEFKNRGFASSLLKSILNEYSKNNVYVFADNEGLDNFYKKIGFNKSTVWAQLETL